jgi:hypothetical protein
MRGMPGLESVFRDALGAIGIPASGLLLGCVGSVSNPTSETITRDSGFVPVACESRIMGSPLSAPILLRDIRPTLPVEYMYLTLPRGGVESWGVPCKGASASSACLGELEASPQWGVAQLETMSNASETLLNCTLLATQGDEVLVVTTRPELNKFLGAVDTLGEAELLVACQNAFQVDRSIPLNSNGDYHLECGRSGGVPREDGFLVLAFMQERCSGRTRHLLHVDGSGRISKLDSFTEREPEPNCAVGRRPEGPIATAPSAFPCGTGAQPGSWRR